MTGIKGGNGKGKRRGLIVQSRDLELLRELAVMRVADREQAKIAAGFGSALAGVIAPIARPVRAVAVVALVVIGVRGLRTARSRPTDGRTEALPPALPATYLRLLVLTLLNPATVVYFAALMLGMPALGNGPADRAGFVAGVSVASLSWQLLLAAIGALAHRRLPSGAQAVASIAGNLVVLAFAAVIAYGLATG